MLNRLKTYLGASKLYNSLRVIIEKSAEALFVIPRLSSGRKKCEAVESGLRVMAHALEKGMSIGDARPGFGKAKAEALIAELQHYLDIGGNKRIACECCSIIDKYIRYNEGLGADMCEIDKKNKDLCLENDLQVLDFGGILYKSYEDIASSARSDFAAFSHERWAIRDFGDKPISLAQIKTALKLSEKTPSACNRQSWRVHVISTKDKRNMLFEMQGGCRGFYQDCQYAILVSCALSSYRFYELNQCYVDGGLYAMNLIYALHYSGVATIPLTMSLPIKRLRRIIKTLGLPNDEVPVLLIGAGSYKDCFKVAESERIPYAEYVTIDK